MRSRDSSTEPTGRALDLASVARALADASTGLVIWKGGCSLSDAGDVDASAPAAEHNALRQAFHVWACSQGLAATLSCTHAVGTTILVGCGGASGDDLLQVDLVDRKHVHGVPVWTAEQLGHVADEHSGVRCLRMGAEGVARVLANPGDEDGRTQVRMDPAGARTLGELLGLHGRLATRTGLASRLALRGVLAVRAIASPQSVLRAASTDRGRRGCPVIAALLAGRRLPAELDSWLDAIARDHEVRRA